MCKHRPWSTTMSLAVCMLAKYGYIMLDTITQKYVFGHNFWTKAHRMMILVSKAMFWGSRYQIAPLILLAGLSVHKSVHMFMYLSIRLSVHLAAWLCISVSISLFIHQVFHWGLLLTAMCSRSCPVRYVVGRSFRPSMLKDHQSCTKKPPLQILKVQFSL